LGLIVSDEGKKFHNIDTQVFSEKFIAELAVIIKKNREEQELIDNFQVRVVISCKKGTRIFNESPNCFIPLKM
jgi:hypothetical protein